MPGFDATKVKGLIAALFKLKDMKVSTALEVVAGGRLFNVVVDNEETGKYLLEKGKLAKRVTIIPLNKISSVVTSDIALSNAKKLVGEDTVNLALSFIEYDPSLEPV